MRKTDLDQIRPHLVAGYERISKQNAVGLRMLLEYGCWLELAYELFKLKKWNGQNGDSGSWQQWLKVNVGICPRYSQMPREVAKLLQNYSRFQNVGISFQKSIGEKNQLQIYCKRILLLHATGKVLTPLTVRQMYYYETMKGYHLDKGKLINSTFL